MARGTGAAIANSTGRKTLTRIFIAEDDAASRELLCDALEIWGYQVTAFAHGGELLQAIGCDVPELFILDVQMPVCDGIETVKRLRQQLDPLPPAIALTAFAMQQDRQRILAAGFDEYVSKPLELSELRATIQRVLQTVET